MVPPLGDQTDTRHDVLTMRGTRSLIRSDELRSVTTRYWAAFLEGDTDAVIARYSLAHGITMIGTDEGEYIEDPDRLLDQTRVELASLGGWPLAEAQIDAWEQGDVGWSVIRSTVGSGDDRHALRVTLVFHLERGEWLVVHQHWSVGAPNDEIYGVPLAYGLEQLAEAVETERPDLTEWAASDGTITLVFTDIEDSTELTGSFGDRAWIEVLRVHNEVVERQTVAHGGSVVKRMGDGYMLVFPAARRALRAALAIKSEVQQTFIDPGSPIRVRIGVHTGEVVRRDDAFFGQSVNYAARVAAAGAGGEVLASRLVRDLVEADREFAFEPSRDVLMKGVDGRQVVYPLATEDEPS
jgi:class 3 adenylate cyclase